MRNTTSTIGLGELPFILDGKIPVSMSGKLFEAGEEKMIGFRSPNEREIESFKVKYPALDTEFLIAPLGAMWRKSEGRDVMELGISTN